MMAEETVNGNVVDIQKLKQQVFSYVELSLGSQMVEVELDPAHYETCLQRAVEVFQTRSSAAVEESFAFLSTQKDVQIYTLPEEVQYVRQIWRRSLGDLGNAGTQIDPFSQGYLNVYILNSGRAGGLLNYELFKDYEFQVDRMFGGQIDFNFNSITKKLSLIRRPYGTNETLLLQTYNLKPLVQLLVDYRTLTFIKGYTLALCKHALGEAREKYTAINGPGGGTSLNGAALKAEAMGEMDKMHEDISNFRFGETPVAFIIG
jgi:hypothetical protein